MLLIKYGALGITQVPGLVAHSLIQHWGSRGKRSFLSSRLSRSAYHIPGYQGLHGEIFVSKKKKQRNKGIGSEHNNKFISKDIVLNVNYMKEN